MKYQDIEIGGCYALAPSWRFHSSDVVKCRVEELGRYRSGRVVRASYDSPRSWEWEPSGLRHAVRVQPVDLLMPWAEWEGHNADALARAREVFGRVRVTRAGIVATLAFGDAAQALGPGRG